MRIAAGVILGLVMLSAGCAPPAGAPPRVVRYAFKNFTESRLFSLQL